MEKAKTIFLPFLYFGENTFKTTRLLTMMPFLQVGMWVIPVGLCLRNHWWRFPCVWLAFSGITGVVTKKCTEKPIDVSDREVWQQRTRKKRKILVIKHRKRDKERERHIGQTKGVFKKLQLIFQSDAPFPRAPLREWFINGSS